MDQVQAWPCPVAGPRDSQVSAALAWLCKGMCSARFAELLRDPGGPSLSPGQCVVGDFGGGQTAVRGTLIELSPTHIITHTPYQLQGMHHSFQAHLDGS